MKPSLLSRREKLLLTLLTSTLIFSASFSYGAVSQSKVDSIMQTITSAGNNFSSQADRDTYYQRVYSGLADAVTLLITVQNNVGAMIGTAPVTAPLPDVPTPTVSPGNNPINTPPLADWSNCKLHTAPDETVNILWDGANIGFSKDSMHASQEYVAKLVVPTGIESNNQTSDFSWNVNTRPEEANPRWITISRNPCPPETALWELANGSAWARGDRLGSIDAWEIANYSDWSKYFQFVSTRPTSAPTNGGDVYNKLYPGEWYITVRPVRSTGAKSSMICKQCLLNLYLSRIPKVSNIGISGWSTNTDLSTISISQKLTNLPFVWPTATVQGYTTGQSCSNEGQHPTNQSNGNIVTALVCNGGVIKWDCSYGWFGPYHPGLLAQCDKNRLLQWSVWDMPTPVSCPSSIEALQSLNKSTISPTNTTGYQYVTVGGIFFNVKNYNNPSDTSLPNTCTSWQMWLKLLSEKKCELYTCKK